MLLGNLLRSVKGKYRKITIKGISFDSRQVKDGDTFFAIDGSKTSGSKFLNEAVKKGARIIITNHQTNFKKNKIPIYSVKDVRKSLSEACSNFYKKKPKNIVAVTGTNGKSSVANFYYQIMSFNKIRAASIGTLGINSKNFTKKTNLTSMDPLSLHKNLMKIKKNKINNVIVEASSHGLDQKRLNYLNIKTAIFTNLSHDHLDYHKNMKSYLDSKMYLFKHLIQKNSTIIADEDTKEFGLIKKISKKRKLKKITIGANKGKIIILKNYYKNKYQIINPSYVSKDDYLIKKIHSKYSLTEGLNEKLYNKIITNLLYKINEILQIIWVVILRIKINQLPELI